MKRHVAVLLSGAALLVMSGANGQTAKPAAQTTRANGIAVNPQLASKEWPTYGHDSGGMRFSPLTQITPANVAKLQVAWSYHLKPADFTAPAGGRGGNGAPRTNTPVTQAPGASGPGMVAAPSAPAGGRGNARFSQSEVTPLVIDGVMYLTTPYRKVVALDATTGKEIWSVDGSGSTRGLEYWPGDKNTPPQIIWVEGGGLVSVSAKSGQPNPHFGVGGKVMPDGGLGGGGGSSPPIIYKNIIISGTANPNKDGRMGGDIRGFDAATGKQLWRFDTVPVKGEKGYETWAPGSAERQTAGGVHVWGLMTVDAERGLVYAPINAPDWNRYGGDHPGNNLYSSSIVALDANTGRLVWHFQIVHHDIWDMDAESPPTLFDVKRGGKTIPAVGIISKSALLFIMNRVTGEPIYGVEERPVPQSEIPEERTSPTQPFPVKPEPLGRQTMSAAEINTVSPAVTAFCKDILSKNVGLGGPYMPPGFNHPTVNFPGPNGSVNWGGASFSPKLGYYFVNSQDLGQLTEEGPKGLPRQAIGVTGVGAPADDNIPYDMVGLNGRFKEPTSNMMCQQPPWGRLTAVNVNTGNIAWQVPLGITESLPPGQQKTGRPNSGGSIVTASGLVFIGATDDSRFRAFDAKTGKEIWTVKLPAGSHSVPITYMGRNGKQYLVFPATGGNLIQDPALDDELIAYALPGK